METPKLSDKRFPYLETNEQVCSIIQTVKRWLQIVDLIEETDELLNDIMDLGIDVSNP